MKKTCININFSGITKNNLMTELEKAVKLLPDHFNGHVSLQISQSEYSKPEIEAIRQEVDSALQEILGC